MREILCKSLAASDVLLKKARRATEANRFAEFFRFLGNVDDYSILRNILYAAVRDDGIVKKNEKQFGN